MLSWKTMYEKVNDPTTQTAYSYDMSFGGDRTGTQFVCSAVSQHIYSTISENPALKGGDRQLFINPYYKCYLSGFHSRSHRLLSALSIQACAVPSPGDLELNRFFERVGFVIRVDKLEQERIEAAIVDYTLNYLGDQRAHELLQFLDHLKTINSDDLLKLEQLKIVPKAQMLKLTAVLAQVPAGVGLNQIAFFYFIDNIWTPAIRTEVLKQIGGAQQIVGLDATYDIVAKTVKAVWKQKYQALQEFIGQRGDCASELKPDAPPGSQSPSR